MSEAIETIFQAAMALPPYERVELVEALIAECDQELQRPFADAWLAEVSGVPRKSILEPSRSRRGRR